MIANLWQKRVRQSQRSYSERPRVYSKPSIIESRPWFRGQSNVKYDLTPSLARILSGEPSINQDIQDVEDYFYNRFVMSAGPYLVGVHPQDYFEWNYVMRHHAVPSRLLDWTEGSLVGLYYAVHNLTSGTSAVWMLEPNQLIQMTLNSLFIPGEDHPFRTRCAPELLHSISSQNPRIKALRKIYFNDIKSFRDDAFYIDVDGVDERITDVPGLRDYPLPIIPNHVSRRLASHLSRFTLHSLTSSNDEVMKHLPGSDRSLAQFARDAFARLQTWFLVKLIISADSRMEMLRNLQLTGVSDMNFSQDLDGLTKQIQIRFRLADEEDHLNNDI